MNKYIFVSGGVCSSLGKGIAASSIGALLECRGNNVRMVKCDPYINANASMNLDEHGEVYVTDDGAQTDLDLGNYARFTSGHLTKANSMTTGQVYKSVIEREKSGGYSGRCVQVIPHITDEIKNRIMAAAKDDETDFVIVEIGGTVGDIESVPFLEAARQMIHSLGKTNAISVHLTLIPKVADDEYKTKPTQHSVKAMQEMGIQPDILICRSPIMLDEATRKKIALFTNVDPDAVFTSCNVDTTIYEVPLMFYGQKLDQVVLKKMGVPSRHANLGPWNSMLDKVKARKGSVRIGIVGQYMDLNDAYKSLYEALFHAGLENGVEVELVKIDSAKLEEAGQNIPDGIDGILVPGGGRKGIDGMVKAAAWARKAKVPYFGICLGMKVMLTDWGRNVLGEDFVPADAQDNGGTMRLGASEITVEKNSHIFAAYSQSKISERHRHEFEFSSQYKDKIASSGLKITANNSENDYIECIEWPDHPWGVGVQFYPEFKSKPMVVSPLFRDFIASAKKVGSRE